MLNEIAEKITYGFSLVLTKSNLEYMIIGIFGIATIGLFLKLYAWMNRVEDLIEKTEKVK